MSYDTQLPNEIPQRIFDKASFKIFLQEDLAAHGVKRWTFDLRFRNPALHYQRCLRRVEYYRIQQGFAARILRFVFRFQLQRVSLATGLSIPPGVFGPGLYIAHFGSIVVNSRARVGARCQIHSATNIGVGRNGSVPTIGDDVYIGPGAVIYGQVTIGSGSAIGANSVVNSDVPEGRTVAGAPARLVGSSGSASLVPDWGQPTPSRESIS